MGYRETFGLCLALAACAGTSTIGGGKGSGGTDATGATAGTDATGGTGATHGTGASAGTDATGGTGAIPGTRATGGTGATAGTPVTSGSSGTGSAKGGDSSVDVPLTESCGHETCGEGESCCLLTLTCFDPVVRPEACPPPPEREPEDPNPFAPCTSNTHCNAGEFCMTEWTCAGPGFCLPLSSCPTCDDGGSGFCKVCGCDGKTYDNTNAACLAGVNAHFLDVACGESLGVRYVDDEMNGIAAVDAGSPEAEYSITVCGSDADCPADDEACCAITTVCYPKSDPGQCAIPPPGTHYPCTSNAQCWDGEYCAGEGCGTPGGCTGRDLNDEGCGELFEPVCGCDGKSYTSAQCAIKAGTRVASEGECP